MARKTELLSLDEARGRVLAKNLASKVDDPRFDNSAMDGFAVRADDCAENGSVLRIAGVSQAGGEAPPRVSAGEACRIMTGAPMPEGADAIVMVEDTSVEGDSVTVLGPARPGFIRRRAENLAKGQEALPSGANLTPAGLALAATMGHGEVEVVARPRIAILSTGDELVPAGSELTEGQIHESNSHAIASLVERMGCEAIRLEAVQDSLDSLRSTLDALVDCDAIITSGGVSMGEFDLVRKIIEEEGDIHFWRMKVRPGGPPLFGSWKGTPLFGLPGNPVSSQVVFTILVAPWIAHSLGYDEQLGPRLARRVRVRLVDAVRGAPGKLCLRRIRINSDGDQLTASTHTHQGSGNLHSLVAHDALTLLPPDTDAVAGQIIDALWLY